MRNFYYSWRFYTYGRERYSESINKVFSNNLTGLRQANTLVAILAGCFSIFPLAVEGNFIKSGILIGGAIAALLLTYVANYMMQKFNVKNRTIYLLMSLCFFNIMLLGVYLDIWSDVDVQSTIYQCLLVCSLLMFINPPHFNFFLILGAMVIYTGSAFLFKSAPYAVDNAVNILIAGILAMFFSWHITKLRLGLELSTIMLEDEKNRYFDQSTVDELTQLKNRRDFQQTFSRYLSTYRSSDDWFCIALADIDFFKLYNDNYGHPQGDKALRSIGTALNGLRDDLGVYPARVGGEEFAVIWFEKDAGHVEFIITKWMEAIKNLKIPHEKSKASEYVTMSVGVYIAKCGSTNDTSLLYDRADKALYVAKSSGRNCAIISGDEVKQYKFTI